MIPKKEPKDLIGAEEQFKPTVTEFHILIFYQKWQNLEIKNKIAQKGE
jgi:hypothetical protein